MKLVEADAVQWFRPAASLVDPQSLKRIGGDVDYAQRIPMVSTIHSSFVEEHYTAVPLAVARSQPNLGLTVQNRYPYIPD